MRSLSAAIPGLSWIHRVRLRERVPHVMVGCGGVERVRVLLSRSVSRSERTWDTHGGRLDVGVCGVESLATDQCSGQPGDGASGRTR